MLRGVDHITGRLENKWRSQTEASYKRDKKKKDKKLKKFVDVKELKGIGRIQRKADKNGEERLAHKLRDQTVEK